MYTESSIERIREVDIVTIVGHYLELKKEGANYKALSPFTKEKTPSFVVSPQKQMFSCFSTGTAGDGIKFVILHKSFDFIQAVEAIAEIGNVSLDKEHVTEEQQKNFKQRTDLYKFSGNVAKKYTTLLHALPRDHWAKRWLEERKFSKEILALFSIGYAPGGIVAKNAVEHGKLSEAMKVGLVKNKDGSSYDAFKDRIVFPIHNRKGNIVGFGGRRSDDEALKKYAKYLNSAESDIYKKSKVLYGLQQAWSGISKTEKAVVVEGYTDVISMHQNGFTNTVGVCGTAFTLDQGKLIRQIANEVVLLFDGDAAGLAAIKKSIPLILRLSMKATVCILPEGKDPDEVAREGSISEYIKDNAMDAILWTTELYKDATSGDPMAQGLAVDELAKLVGEISHESARQSYIKLVSKKIGVTALELRKAVKAFGEKNIKAANNPDDYKGLPEGADKDQYLHDGFAIAGNCYHVQMNNGFGKATNFIVTPLFHIDGKKDNRRLCEVVNELGHKRLIDFESKALINFNSFQERLINEGNFIFKALATNIHFKMIAQSLARDFITAYELKVLGWQAHDKFLAYADGVFADGVFKEVNKYGIVQLERDDKNLSEYSVDVKNFYSPAFSEVYKNSREDDDPYENDRFFIYKKSGITITEWTQKMVRVYGKRGRIGVAFALASMFRDFIINRHNFFPHLYLTGEKESGKSTYAGSIAGLFTLGLSPFDLNSGSLVGFYRRIARIKNIPVVLEEFNDKIDQRMFQGLKAAYDGRGREIGVKSNDNKTSISKVNSSCIITGQYLSAKDDNALTSRSIVMHFIKAEYTNADKEAFNDLRNYEQQGMSSLIVDVVKHRDYFCDTFHKRYLTNGHRFRKELEAVDFQERMLQNYNALYTPVEILSEKMDLGIELEPFFLECLEGIIDNSDLIIESEGLAEFWRILEHLQKTQRIIPDRDYVVDEPIDFKISTSKTTRETWKNTERHQILFIRLGVVHQEYHNEVSRRDGSDVIGEATLRNYFKAKKYFIGPVKSKRFRNAGAHSCYAFNYSIMQRSGILSLNSIEAPGGQPITVGYNDSDETPF